MVRSELFREVFEQSHIPQVLISLDLSAMLQNQAFFDYLGYTREEWAHMAIKDISPREDYETDSIFMQELISGKRSYYQLEKRYYHKSGRLLYGTLNVSLISDPETEKQYIFAQVLDTTEKLRMNESLRSSEKKYRLLAEHSSDLVMLHDPDGTYQYLSPSFKTLLGYEPSQLIGCSPYDYIHSEDIPIVRKHHLQLAEKKIMMPLVSYRVRKLDGSYIWVETDIKPVVDEKTGELTELISISRDVQQRIDTYELLRKSERLAIVGQMAAAVAHEIRNPLTPIKGFITLLSKTKEYNPVFIDVILNEIKRIETIITEFLAMAKPNNRKMNHIQVNDLVKQVVHLIQTEALMENKQITLHLEATPPVSGDENSLKQVFLNVLRNALESLAAQGTVSISTFTEGGLACIQIQDNGCGIPQERLAKIGEPFYSTKEKGTGLGLMTSLNIIENHQGRMEIQSEEGEGTTVKIYLPALSNSS
ncbi:PAS domain S-box protein [Bacillus sp. FJAT-42376]|uniref:PAS domain-containing sensor histidine kinase n=1 Tax=Bacillus sp. FJAT-42376 TaxID=2014076 RepID=UPI000F4E548C|nr:PAS domain S-box protein [Bacillus sp. FJAT-42376]AZB41080.1 PAS domain S-box protein [Bacillus sp. FJAT-42376]